MLIPLLSTWIGLTACVVQKQSGSTTPGVSESFRTGETGSEETLRDFLLAIGTKDEAKLRSITLPHDDFEWLLKGQAVPNEIRKEFETFVRQSPIRTLRAGEVVRLPGGRELKVGSGEVTGDRIMLLFGQDPMPHKLRKVDGVWKVDPTTIVTARKAADEARRKKAAP